MVATLNGHRRFVAAPATAHLTFDENSPLYGLEVEMRTRLSVADIIRLGQAWSNKDPDEIEEASSRIGSYLVSWNLDEEGGDGESEPVPATEEGWASRDGMTQVIIFQKFMDHINSGGGGHAVEDPKLSTESSNGKRPRMRPETTGAS